MYAYHLQVKKVILLLFTKMSLHSAWLKLQRLSTLRATGLSVQILSPSNMSFHRHGGVLSCAFTVLFSAKKPEGLPCTNCWHPFCTATSLLVPHPANSSSFSTHKVQSLPPQLSMLAILCYSPPPCTMIR